MSRGALAQGRCRHSRSDKMPFTLTGPPEEAASQLIAHLKRRGVLDESGNVAKPVAISAQADGAVREQPSHAKQTPQPFTGQGNRLDE